MGVTVLLHLVEFLPDCRVSMQLRRVSSWDRGTYWS
jgi:hypothetical protein